jgi:hypothetical protein
MQFNKPVSTKMKTKMKTRNLIDGLTSGLRSLAAGISPSDAASYLRIASGHLRLLCTVLVLVGLAIWTSPAATAFDNSLWIGNDISVSLPVLNTDRAGNVLRQINAPIPTSGIAIDLSSNTIFTGGNFGSAAITPRDLTTLAISGPSFTPATNFQEDMAFDGTYIWRISSQHILEKIDPITGNLIQSIAFTLAGPATLGLAWDGSNFWISEGTPGGMIRQITPAGLFTGVAFSVSTSFSPAGLAYDTTDNTLFIGTNDAVYHYDLSGNQLGSFSVPGRLVDGLEFQPQATATATPTPTATPRSTVCPLTIGYWKNHPNAWPVNTLMLGSQTYTKTELLNILNNPGGGDASMILAVQLIAAKLNIANGSDPTPVSGTITHADSLLSGFSGKLPYNVKPSSSIGQMMVNDGKTLDNYNNGLLTPGCH